MPRGCESRSRALPPVRSSSVAPSIAYILPRPATRARRSTESRLRRSTPRLAAYERLVPVLSSSIAIVIDRRAGHETGRGERSVLSGRRRSGIEAEGSWRAARERRGRRREGVACASQFAIVSAPLADEEHDQSESSETRTHGTTLGGRFPSCAAAEDAQTCHSPAPSSGSVACKAACRTRRAEEAKE